MYYIYIYIYINFFDAERDAQAQLSYDDRARDRTRMDVGEIEGK